MKHLLIFTYYWPPGSNPGVLRMMKMCKYLPEFGWKPIVVTVKDGSYPSVDESLLQRIPPETEVYHTSSLEPFRVYNLLSGKKGKASPVGMANIKDSQSLLQRLSLWIRANLFIPDARKGWLPYAKRQGEQLLKSRKIDAILTTGPPHSTHLAGLHLKRQFGTPWVADLRDPWTNIYYNAFLPRSTSARKKDQFLENEVAREASGLTTVSKGLVDEFKDRNSNIHLIFNGFDASDFDQDTPYKRSDRFRMAFFGNLLPSQDIPTLWDALRELVETNEAMREKLELVFIGNVHERIMENLRQRGLGDNVKRKAFMPHREAVAEMQRSDMLLFIIPDTPDNHLIITGKLFEYLASGTPILAVGPTEGDASAILTETGRDAMHPFGDTEGIQAQVTRYFEQWQGEGTYPRFGMDEATMRYSRRAQTERLVSVLDPLTHVS